MYSLNDMYILTKYAAHAKQSNVKTHDCSRFHFIYSGPPLINIRLP